MAEIIGTDDKDTLDGGDADDWIDGKGGSDDLSGNGGNDTIIGGAGWNTIKGGGGNDLIVGGENDDFISGNGGDDTIIGGAGNEYGNGRGGNDLIFCGDGDDTIKGGGGYDTVIGGAGNDVVEVDGAFAEEPTEGGIGYGGDGDDWVGEMYDTQWWNSGADKLGGGRGNDTLHGGTQNDRFYFEFSQVGEGNDRIDDLKQGDGDKIVINIEDALAADPNLAAAAGNAGELTLADFDADPDWTITRGAGGKVLITHPNGTILIANLNYGYNTNSFQDLAWGIEISHDKLDLPDEADYWPVAGGPGPDPDPEPEPDPEPDPVPGLNPVIGNDWDEWLKGTNDDDFVNAKDGDDVVRGYAGNDVMFGRGGDDTLRGEAGDDEMTGGEGADVFEIRAGKWGEGADTVTDFERGTDTIDVNLADILDAEAAIRGLSGDANTLELFDLEASGSWTITASADGDVLITHPTGSIELNGIAYDETTDSFADLSDILTLDGAAIPVGTEADPGPGPDPDPGPGPDPDPDPGPDPTPGLTIVEGNDWDEWLKGTDNADFMTGKAGDDVVRGYAGDDEMFGGTGNDTLRGEAGDDVMTGGADADVFTIRAGKWGEGADHVTDFVRGVDKIDLSSADLDPATGALSGDVNALELNDLDASDQWSLGASGDGDVLITHSTGSIELDGIAFDDTWDSFADLTDVLTLDGAAIPVGTPADPDPGPDPGPDPDPVGITGNPWDEWLKGTDNADVMDALGGNDVVRGYAGDDTMAGGEGDDTLRGEAGNDEMTGGTGADVFEIRSGKWGEGDDVVTDFELGTDKIVFDGREMLDENPGLAGAAGGPELGLDDLDADPAFSLGASADGDLLITHQTGTVELDGIAFDATTDSFVEIANILDIEIA